jgi:signal transduction histidine kinase
MSALLVEMGNLASAMPPDPALQKRMQAVRTLAENNVIVLRNLALLLRPSMLDDLGLVPALKWQARETSRRSGVKVRIDAEDAADDLPDEYRTCIYRVVQEALHNVAKHSHATQVRVSVRRAPAKVSVTIQDDGSGFANTREKGLGILGMEERVRSLKGTFHIASAPGKGATLEIELPLDPAAVPAPSPITV